MLDEQSVAAREFVGKLSVLRCFQWSPFSLGLEVSLTPRFSGVTGHENENQTVSTVLRVSWHSERGQKPLKRFPPASSRPTPSMNRGVNDTGASRTTHRK